MVLRARVAQEETRVTPGMQVLQVVPAEAAEAAVAAAVRGGYPVHLPTPTQMLVLRVLRVQAVLRMVMAGVQVPSLPLIRLTVVRGVQEMLVPRGLQAQRVTPVQARTRGLRVTRAVQVPTALREILVLLVMLVRVQTRVAQAVQPLQLGPVKTARLVRQEILVRLVMPVRVPLRVVPGVQPLHRGPVRLVIPVMRVVRLRQFRPRLTPVRSLRH